MNRVIAFLTIAAACCAAPAEDIPPPREAPDAKRLSHDERFASRGQVDLYIAASAALDMKAEDERLWTPALKLKAKVIELADLKGDRRPSYIFATFAAYRKSTQPQLILRVEGTYTRAKEDDRGQTIDWRPIALRAGGVGTERGLAGLVVSRGRVHVKGVLSEGSLILANGDVAARDIIGSVIVCDGDVDAPRVMKSLIIARGKITVKEAEASTLIAGGAVAAGKVPPPALRPATNPEIQERNRQKLLEFEQVRVEIKENEPNPLGYVTFFELSAVGLEVKAADKAVTVAKVAAGSAAEKAGVKAGDVVLEASGKKPSDAEALRRLLRDALAVGDATVKLKRGEETISVRLSLPE